MEKQLFFVALPILLLFSITKLEGQCDASFTYEADCNCVTFTPADTTLCDYTWSFGDGGTSNEIIPTYCYPFTGNDSTTINVSLSIDCALAGVSCDSSLAVAVPQVPDATLNPLNAPGWINCNTTPGNPIFTLVVENISTTSVTDSLYILNWGDSLMVGNEMIANIDTIPGGSFNMPLVNTYLEYQTYELTITVIGQNQCVSTTTYEFINSRYWV